MSFAHSELLGVTFCRRLRIAGMGIKLRIGVFDHFHKHQRPCQRAEQQVPETKPRRIVRLRVPNRNPILVRAIQYAGEDARAYPDTEGD